MDNLQSQGRVSGVDITYHYPPELLQLLIDTIPRLCKSKRDVFAFLRGAGIDRSMISDLEAQLAADRESISKFHIVRTVLTRVNEAGETGLRERREVLKRVVEYEDFSTCWPEDRLEAQGLVSRIRSVVDVKDSFTRMRQEREAETRKNLEDKRRETEALRQQQEIIEAIRKDFNRLFAMDDAHKRGKLLEGVLNRLFEADGILVRESFTRVAEPGHGVIEQVDGVVELDGHIYLAEMKWLKESVGRAELSEHMVRVFSRSASRGIFISYSEYTTPAIDICKDLSSKVVIVLCTLQEFVMLLESDMNLVEFLKTKIQGSIIDKQPYTRVLPYLS